MGSTKKVDPKKPYEPPALAVFGTVEDLTKSVALHGQSDTGRGFRSHTSVR